MWWTYELGGIWLIAAITTGAAIGAMIWWLARHERPRKNRHLSGREAYRRMLAKRGAR